MSESWIAMQRLQAARCTFLIGRSEQILFCHGGGSRGSAGRYRGGNAQNSASRTQCEPQDLLFAIGEARHALIRPEIPGGDAAICVSLLWDRGCKEPARICRLHSMADAVFEARAVMPAQRVETRNVHQLARRAVRLRGIED